MFEKQKLQFSNKSVFGYSFKPSYDYCSCKTAKMLISGKLNTDGTIDESRADTFNKSDLWAYIYYIYYYNNSDVEEFKEMTNKSGKADPFEFYRIIKAIGDNVVIDENDKKLKTVNTLTLIKFINNIVVNMPDLTNPVIDFLKKYINDNIVMNMKGIKLVTGNAKNAKYVNANSANANIKISLVNSSKPI